MPGKRDPDKGPVTVFLPRELIAAARERVRADGTTMTELVAHVFREYTAGRFTLPPPQPGPSPDP